MRKLAIAAFSFSAAIFAANFLLTRGAVLYAALFCALAGAAVLLIRLKSLKGVVIAAFAASIGFAVFAAHYDLTILKAHQLAGQTDSFSFSLLENPREYERYTSVQARLEHKGFPRLKCILYASDGNMRALKGGDRITAELKLSPADIRYGMSTSRYRAKDVYLTGTVKGEILITGHRGSLASLSAAAADQIAARMDELFDRSTAPFIKALIMGDKSDLYEDDELYVSLSRAGLMHVAAVSGMHVSFLIAFLRFLLGKGKRSAVVCILLAWAFVAVSGMSPSAVRAAFMQTMLLLAPLFNRENDPVTSLSAALALLLLVNPFAAANISLQLSFAAMLGIVLFFERLQELLIQPFGEGRTAELLRAPLAIISCSLSVMVFSLPLTAFYFGYVSALSPLTNLLCLWAVPLCFIGAFTAACLSWIPLAGKLIVLVVSWLVKYLFAVCRLISSLSFSAVYLPGRIAVLWSVVFYLAVALVFLVKLRSVWRLLIPTAAAVIGLVLCQNAMELRFGAAGGTITAIDVGQGQCISIFSGGHTVLIDCGSTSYGEYNAGDCAAAYLKSRGVERIDAVVFTHLHEDHANGYERLSNLMEIDSILLAANVDGADPQLWEILSCAEKHKTEVEYISYDAERRFGDIRLRLFADEGEGNENERCMAVIASVGDYDMITTGDASAEREKKLAETTELSETELLIAGHHGSKSASCREYLAALAGDKAIVCVGKNNYGLPAPEVLERLAKFGYTVYRTDTDGDVEIRIDG